MLRNLFLVVASMSFVAVGWLIGSIYPAPAFVMDRVKRDAGSFLAFAELGSADIEKLRASVSQDEFRKIMDKAAEFAAKSGNVVIVERDERAGDQQAGFTLEEPATRAQAPKPVTPTSDKASEPTAQTAPVGSASAKTDTAMLASSSVVVADPALFDQVRLCPRMSISNQPAADGAGVLVGDARRASVNGVIMLLNPTRGACLASGFGQRGAKLHKGLDYHAPIGIDVLAAADGKVIEKKYRPDYGNMVVIEHRRGVYTRYAHLSSFDAAILVGADVKLGQRLGLMGNTADYPIPVHLHWELLLGDIANPKGSFGLTPHSPFDFAIRKG